MKTELKIKILLKLTQNAVISLENRRATSQSHRAAHLSRMMFGHVDDERILRIYVNLRGVGIRKIQNVPRILNDHRLQSQANAQNGLVIHATPVAGADLALDTTRAESTRNDDAIAGAELLPRLVVQHRILLLCGPLQVARFDVLELEIVTSGYCRMLQSLRHGCVRVF